MMNLTNCRMLPALLLALSVSVAASAEETTKKKKKANAALKGRAAAAFKIPDAVKLTEEQQTKLTEVKTEFTPKLTELQQKQGAILTKEQRQTRKTTLKQLKDEGKKGKELRLAVAAAVTLTEEQKTAQKETEEKFKALEGEVHAKIEALLTAEQKEIYAKQTAGKKRADGAKPKKKKKPADAAAPTT